MSDEAVEPVKRALRRLALRRGAPPHVGPLDVAARRDDAPNASFPDDDTPPDHCLHGTPERARPPRTDVERAVERAEAAVRDVRAAAQFAEDGGFARLESAVDAADSEGRAALAARGRSVLGTVAAYRTACADHVHSGREGLMGGEPVLTEETT